jgi:hypothetical protein
MLGHDLPEGVLDAICEQSGDYSRERRDRAEQDVFNLDRWNRPQNFYRSLTHMEREYGRALCAKQSS